MQTGNPPALSSFWARRTQLVMVGFPQQAASPRGAESRRTALQEVHSTPASRLQLHTTLLGLITLNLQPVGFAVWRSQSFKAQLRDDWMWMWFMHIAAYMKADSFWRGISHAAASRCRSLKCPSFKVESMHYKRENMTAKRPPFNAW